MSSSSATTVLAAMPADLVFPSASAGFDTCWSFLARAEPWALEMMTDPVMGLVEDERTARQIAKAMGAHIPHAPAPDALAAAGVTEVGIYPAAVLERVFPVHP